jgi:hypothetical protein
MKGYLYEKDQDYALRSVRPCPSVEISDAGVTIGEDENTVKLSHAEWNDLVSRIKSGELCEV